MNEPVESIKQRYERLGIRDVHEQVHKFTGKHGRLLTITTTLWDYRDFGGQVVDQQILHRDYTFSGMSVQMADTMMAYILAKDFQHVVVLMDSEKEEMGVVDDQVKQ